MKVRIALFCACAMLAVSVSSAGEQASAPPVQIPLDPFSEVLKDLPIERISAGSSCVLLKMPLPEGVSPEELGIAPPR